VLDSAPSPIHMGEGVKKKEGPSIRGMSEILSWSVMQVCCKCVASVLLCVAVCCSVLQFIAVCCSVYCRFVAGFCAPPSTGGEKSGPISVRYVRKCVCVCARVCVCVCVCVYVVLARCQLLDFNTVAMCCNVLQCVAMPRCQLLDFTASHCNTLQHRDANF